MESAVSEMIRFDVMLGTVELGRPTGRFVTDPDGWMREIYTDTITRDQNGKEVERRPTEAVIRIRWE